jgi:hypothetical protein
MREQRANHQCEPDFVSDISAASERDLPYRLGPCASAMEKMELRRRIQKLVTKAGQDVEGVALAIHYWSSKG